MKIGQSIRFMLGDSKGMRASLENCLTAYDQDHPSKGYFHGCYAFTLEETGDYVRAEHEGKIALNLAPDDAWGLHAVSHVFDMTGRAKEGLEWMNGKEAAWQHCNNFGYHVWWHIALMHLDLGNFDTVLSLYDNQIRRDKTDDYRDIANATSVLLRLEIEGVDVGERWEELNILSASRVADNCVAFADLHYMMALCHSQDCAPAADLITNMQTSAENKHHCEFTSIIHHPAAQAAQGLEAYRDHNFKSAYFAFKKSKPDLQNIGGSHAQRDIFDRLTIESALRAGLIGEARINLIARDALRGFRIITPAHGGNY